ncbi:glycoside hydrolase family 3 protein [Streptomyces lonarensis]|uniref:Glycoside hydrolase family 3 protein n=1 Tax=Streptomyces lonarensis TaxID=700599 RepID=A0A7X6CZ12_9ACTN|nr:glycoside hydrolase family 3 protein [Streptomyces lonarensis]NJQ05184.1 glycoside hydrolase family 3 protein [Streptomyces lonarensis]
MTAANPSDSLSRDALTVLQPAFDGTDSAPAWLLRLLENGMSGVGLFGRNVVSAEQLTRLNGQLLAANPHALVAVDEEGGDVTRLEVADGSSFPGAHALGAADDPDLTRAVAAEMGRRLAACGVTVNWAPSADVNNNPDNPVIGTRSFGDDPDLVARHTVAFVQGMQATGVAACVKHFPGHGDTDVDSHLALPRIGVDLDTLQRRELVPFRAAVAAGTRCVMSAHLLLPALDPDLPGTLSPAVLHGLLRAPVAEGGLGFDGLIYTDGMEMEAVAATHGIDGGSVMAIAAGADAICIGGTAWDEGQVLGLRDALVRAVREGRLSEERLHEAAERCRELGRWTAAARAAGTTTPAVDAEAIGLDAARRALRVHPAGATAQLRGAPHVASLVPGTNIAVGAETPWGLAAELRERVPGTTESVHPAPEADADPAAVAAAHVPAILDAAGDRTVVAVVRGVHRYRWMSDTLDALVAARPDTVVVEMGVPFAPPTGALHLTTHGAARVCGRAAAEVIAGSPG